MKTIDEMIAVMQAARDGKQIQTKLIPGMATDIPLQWSDCTVQPTWNWDRYDYRVKPEPRRWIVGLSHQGVLSTNLSRNADCEQIVVAEVMK